MRKVLINLDRSTERLGTFYGVNKHIKDVERFSAVDGKGLRSSLKESGLLLEDADALYTDGALGCALSHAEQWRRVISSGGGRTIIEDDAVFCKNFEEEHKRLLKTLPETWDIILWGYNCRKPIVYEQRSDLYCATEFDQTLLQEKVHLWTERHVTGNLFKVIRVLGLFCYSISPKGAKKFLEFCFPLRAVSGVWSEGIDIPMAALYPEMEAYICTPPLVVHDGDISQIFYS